MDSPPFIPPVFQRLLAELESPAPTIDDLPQELFDKGGEYGHIYDKQWWAVRLRIFTAIGNCRTLRNIIVRPIDYQGSEARALLEGLPSNLVLESLDVEWLHEESPGFKSLNFAILVGSYGQNFGDEAVCVALARMLRCTRTLQKLRLYRVGMTSKGLRHVAAALGEANCRSPLRMLDLGENPIGDVSGGQQLAHILATSRTLEELRICDIEGMDVAGAEVIGNALAHNTTLKALFIGCYVNRGPNNSAALSKLVMRAFSGEWSASQETPTSPAFNHSITTLDLQVKKILLGGGESLGEAVQQMVASNTTLTSLVLTANFLRCGLHAAFAHNTTITHLKLEPCLDKDVELEMLIPILRSSRTLDVLDLSDFQDTPASFKSALFQSLQHNPSIRYLVLDGWDGLYDDMYTDLMTSLRVNTNLQSISLDNTFWNWDGKIAKISQALRRNARQVAYLSPVQHADVDFTEPKGGRLILCGAAFAGKTSLREQLIRWCPHLSKSWRGSGLLDWAVPRRTRGIEIQLLRNDDSMEITIWDLAGQDEFRALQDHLFPTITQACIFAFVFSPYDHQTNKLKPEWDKELEKDLRQWLRFIVSNSSMEGHTLPQLYVVLTHLDKIVGATSEAMLQHAMPSIESVCNEFAGVLEIPGASQIFALNAKSSSERDIAPLLQSIFQLLKHLLGKKLKMVPEPCTHMGTILAEWTAQHPTRPVMKVQEFHDLCRKEIDDLQKLTKTDDPRATNILHAISCYLHDVGTIIYFQDLKFMVVNLNWLTHVFLDQLIRFGEHLKACDMLMPTCRDGFVSRSQLQMVLQRFMKSSKFKGFDVDNLIHLMLKLELCYEEKDVGSNKFTKYFVPTTLDDAGGKALTGERPLKWPLTQEQVTLDHMGRRLQYKDQRRTLLGPGFFPRLQVRLRNRLFEKMGAKMKAYQYKNERNLIIFFYDGFEVFVESPGDTSDYVDILMRSHASKTREERRAFLIEHVIEEIHSYCASPQGSQGVTLVEGVIRPACVQYLTLCAHRQAVLKEELMECSSEHKHTWTAVHENGLRGATGMEREIERAELRVTFQLVKELLDPQDLLEGLNRKHRIMQQQLNSIDEAACMVLGPTHGNQGKLEISSTGAQHPTMQPIWGRTMSDFHTHHRTVTGVQLSYLQDIKRLQQETVSLQQQTLMTVDGMRISTQQTLDDIKGLQQLTLDTVLAKADQIMRFSAELVQSELPRRPYFTTKGVGTVHRLVAGIRIGKAVMLHFMCEGTGDNLSHGVEGQVGYELILEDAQWDGIRCIVVNSVRLMVFLAKAGLHVAAGIGGVIPDYVNWGGAMGITGAALFGESLLSNLNAQLPGTSVEQSRCMEEEWPRFKELLKKPLLEGQMTKLFGLFRARLTRGSERAVAWVCEECLKRGKREHLLEPL